MVSYDATILCSSEGYAVGIVRLSRRMYGPLDAAVMDGIVARRAIASDPALALLPATVLPRNYAFTAHSDTALSVARASSILPRLEDR